MAIPSIPFAFDRSQVAGSVSRLGPFLFPGHVSASTSADAGAFETVALTEGTTNAVRNALEDCFHLGGSAALRAVADDAQLYKVTYRTADSGHDGAKQRTSVLIKIYGDGTEITIDREKEIRFHGLLSQHGLAPALLVRFTNGHAYEYLDGRVCTSAQIQDEGVWRAVARELARWHAVLPARAAPAAKPPSNGKPPTAEPDVWATALKWLRALPQDTEAERQRKEALFHEYEFAVQRLLRRPSAPEASAMVLGHGDLLCGNIILQGTGEGADSVRFIDYEHATYCPRAFELANHFAEWGGFECDYSRLPASSTRREFLREYLIAYRGYDASGRHGGREPEGIDDELERLMVEVDDYRGFPGLYWGLCALIQDSAATGTIDFDYAGYFWQRYAEYQAWRQAVDPSSPGPAENSIREAAWAAL